MKTMVQYSLVLLLIAGIISCSKDNNPVTEPTPKAIMLTEGADEVIVSSNDFGVELFTRTASESETNLMLSPLSASVALTMLLNGCDGETYSQIHQMLGYPSGMTSSQINQAYKGLISQLLEVDPKVTITLANAMFYRLGFAVKPPYLNTLSGDFDAQVQGLDFSQPAALTAINGWANDNTMGKIPKVLDEISPDAVMFLMNALYFKGDWTYQFDKNDTQARPFYPQGGGQLIVPTMTGNVMVKRYGQSAFSSIEMPYGQTNFSMVVIVPTDDLSDFYEQFTPELWREITSSLDAQSSRFQNTVSMPKFEFDYEKVLNDQLNAMGMINAFMPFGADLTGISDAGIFVSFVKQNSFVKVDEKGTEAAAVTTIGIELTSVGGGIPRFVIDKPFIFAIRENTTNTLLFIGNVMNP